MSVNIPYMEHMEVDCFQDFVGISQGSWLYDSGLHTDVKVMEVLWRQNVWISMTRVIWWAHAIWRKNIFSSRFSWKIVLLRPWEVWSEGWRMMGWFVGCSCWFTDDYVLLLREVIHFSQEKIGVILSTVDLPSSEKQRIPRMIFRFIVCYDQRLEKIGQFW